jgi:hypothetical protein
VVTNPVSGYEAINVQQELLLGFVQLLIAPNYTEVISVIDQKNGLNSYPIGIIPKSFGLNYNSHWYYFPLLLVGFIFTAI